MRQSRRSRGKEATKIPRSAQHSSKGSGSRSCKRRGSVGKHSDRHGDGGGSSTACGAIAVVVIAVAEVLPQPLVQPQVTAVAANAFVATHQPVDYANFKRF